MFLQYFVLDFILVGCYQLNTIPAANEGPECKRISDSEVKSDSRTSIAFTITTFDP